MAEATKKGPQSTGSTGGRGRVGATDPNPETPSLGGTSSTISGSGTGSATTAGSSASRTAGTTGTSGSASGSSMDMRAENGGRGLMDQMRNSASDTFKTVKSNTTAKIEEQKSSLSSGLMTVADNVQQLGSNLSDAKQRDPLTRIAADYSETAAEKLRTAADYFNTHDVETMYHDVEGLARRNPAIFVGGAFAIGFLAARFLKSSSPRNDRGYNSSRELTSGSSTPRLNAGGSSRTTAM